MDATTEVDISVRMIRAYESLHMLMGRADRAPGPARDMPRTWRQSLLIIDEIPGVSPSMVAHRLGVTPAAVSPAMRQLGERGLIQRTTDPRDARSVQLRIAPRGQEIVEQLRRNLGDLVAELFEPLSQDERWQLVDLLERSLRIEPG